MSNSTSQDGYAKQVHSETPHVMKTLSETFLSQLVHELDNDSVRAIILRGSYARADAFPPYSDVDLTLVIQENTESTQPKRYIWRDGYAISISTRSLSAYQERIKQPEEAIFAVPGIQEARILLDKDNAFRTFQQEVMQFQWASLQSAANTYAGQVMMDQTEIILKILRALRLQDMILLADVLTLDLIPSVTEAFAVHYGILIHSGNTYFHQVQEIAGLQSVWTKLHLCAVGIECSPTLSFEERGIAALHLFQETARLLHSSLHYEHWEAIEPLIGMIDKELLNEKIS